MCKAMDQRFFPCRFWQTLRGLRRWFLLAFTLAAAAALHSMVPARAGGSSAEGVYSVEPLDLQVKAVGNDRFSGVGVTGGLDPQEEDTATLEWGNNRRRACRFVVKVKNPQNQNSSVPAEAYTLFAERRSDKAALYRFHLSTPDGPDITDPMLSDTGYTLEPPFRPGESIYIYVTVVPVGPANEARGIRMFWKSENPSVSGFIPFAVPADRLPDADEIPEEGYEDGEYGFDLYKNPNKGDGDGNPSGSSMGLINVGSYSCGTPEIVEAIENGFQGAIVGTDSDSLRMPVNPGYRKGPVTRAVNTRVGDTVFVPVQSRVEGSGRNATFEVTGVAQCKITKNNFDSKIRASLKNYWDGLNEENLPKTGGGQMYDAIDIAVTVSGGEIQIGDWEELQ